MRVCKERGRAFNKHEAYNQQERYPREDSRADRNARADGRRFHFIFQRGEEVADFFKKDIAFRYAVFRVGFFAAFFVAFFVGRNAACNLARNAACNAVFNAAFFVVFFENPREKTGFVHGGFNCFFGYRAENQVDDKHEDEQNYARCDERALLNLARVTHFHNYVRR